MPAGKTCVRDAFPYAAILNWPFAVSGEVRLGPAGWLTETIELLDVRRGQPIAASVFGIPTGFNVTETN